jgi:ParB/RepB/Spo0J family partition protein
LTIKKIGWKEIGLESIDTTKAQARQSNVNANVDSLAKSISVQGLLQPVIVVQIDEDHYELIAGQRRTIAHRKLVTEGEKKFQNIDAAVYENIMEEWEKKAISINENLCQEEMTEDDKIGAVTACYNQFNNLKTTSEKTGISYGRVSKYVKYVRLPKCLKKLKDDGVISLSTALETATDFSLDSSDMAGNPEEEVIACAKETEKLTRNQKKRVKKILKEKPEKSVLETITEVKGKPDPTKELRIEITSTSYANLISYQQKKKIKNDALAGAELVDEGLEKNKDFIKE